MPRGVYIRTENQKKKMSLSKSGKNHPLFGTHLSEETKKKMSLSKSGENNPNFGRCGEKHPNFGKPSCNKGKPMSEEQKIKIKLSNTGKTHTEETKKKISLKKYGKPKSEEHKIKLRSEGVYLKRIESLTGGIWYGSVTYTKPDNTCLLWNDVNKRTHIFYENRCVICGKVHKSNVGHHVFYERQACCMISNNGEYYTNLNAKDHPLKDYYIGTNPNYFVILCPSCHSKTNGKFKNREKWANYFRELIDTQYGGKCFLTKEEYEIFNNEFQTSIKLEIIE